MVILHRCRFRTLHAALIIAFCPGFPAFRHTDPVSLCRLCYSLPDLVEVGQGEQHLEIVIVLFEASVARLLESKLMLDHPKWMFHFGA